MNHDTPKAIAITDKAARELLAIEISQLKHTPAPWKAVDRKIFEDGSVFPCIVVGGNDERLICYLESVITAELAVEYPNTGWDVSPAESANAQLIAAAPELLEALQLCANVCAGHTSSKSGLIAALEAAKAAIAKALGVQA